MALGLLLCLYRCCLYYLVLHLFRICLGFVRCQSSLDLEGAHNSGFIKMFNVEHVYFRRGQQTQLPFILISLCVSAIC